MSKGVFKSKRKNPVKLSLAKFPQAQLAEFFKRRDGSSGPAGPCRRIDPKTGEVIEILKEGD